MKNVDNVVVVAAKRTPMGAMQGQLSSFTAPELGAIAIQAAIRQAGFSPAAVEEIYFGNVVSAGLKQAPARQAALGAGIAVSVPCTTISKVCGSGMKAVMSGSDQILAGNADIVLAGGMENMSATPHLLTKARQGLRPGHAQLMDSLFLDGLEDAESGRLMGSFAQDTADRFGYTREEMDAYAIRSLERARSAIAKGWFDEEIAAVTVTEKGENISIREDEQPGRAVLEKIPKLKPAFRPDGTVTAANSSSISDGAAALVLARKSTALELGSMPLAQVIAYASHAQKPEEFCLAPIGAIRKVLDRACWSAADVDLFEINEAFAVVSMLAIDNLGIDADRVNINGGACALGHPLGASGARIIVSLVHALKRVGKRRGVASLCIGGGEATAIAIEVV